MTVTYEKLQSWKPDGLSDAADKLNTLRKKLIDQQDEMDAGKPPDSWQTANSSEAARSRHKRLVEDLNDIAAPLSAVVAGLDSAASSLRSAKESAKTAYDGAIGKGWTVKFPGGTQVEIEDPTPPESTAPGHRGGRGGATAHPDQSTMDSYAQTISKALADATEAESELEGVLNTATSGGYDGGDGEIADAVPPEIGAILAAGQEDGDRPDKAAMQRYAALMDELEDEPELKREIMSQMGREGIANAFKNAEATGVDLHAAMGATGRGVIEDWVEHDVKTQGVSGDTATLLGAYKNDAAFTKELFTNVSPDEWADAIKHENGEAFSGGKIDEADRKVYSEFLRASGSAFATYTQGHPDPTGLADKWFKSITEGDDENASALTLMIRKGGESSEFDTDFMYNLTNDVYNWEKSHDGDPVWGPKDVGLVDPDADVRYASRGRGSFDLQSGSANDGLANLLGGMHKSPDAAQRFFMDGYPDGDTSKDNDRLKYLMLDRTFSAKALSDEGDGLGLALEAATTGDRNIEDGDKFVSGYDGAKQNEFSAALASDVMQTVADYSGREYGEDSPGGDWDATQEQWHVWPEMRDSLGAIGAGYANDVYDIIADNGTTRPDELQISKEDFKFVLGEIGHGEDKSGVELLSAAMVQEGNMRVQDEVIQHYKDHPNAPRTMEYINEKLSGRIDGLTTEMGNVVADTLGYGTVVDLHDEDHAAQRAAAMQKAFSIGSSFVPGAGDVLSEGFKAGLGKTGEHFLTSAIDTTTSEGIDALKNAVGGTPPASEWLNSQEDSGKQLIERSLQNNFLNLGLTGEALGPPLTEPTEGGGVRMRDDIHTADDIDKIQGITPAERQELKEAWATWRADGSRYDVSGASTNGLQQFDQRLEDVAEEAKEFQETEYGKRQDENGPPKK